jgi:hypothetical protein
MVSNPLPEPLSPGVDVARAGSSVAADPIRPTAAGRDGAAAQRWASVGGHAVTLTALVVTVLLDLGPLFGVDSGVNAIVTMSPVSSASGMNFTGGTRPRVGCSQRTSASTSTLPAFASDTIGW